SPCASESAAPHPTTARHRPGSVPRSPCPLPRSATHSAAPRPAPPLPPASGIPHRTADIHRFRNCSRPLLHCRLHQSPVLHRLRHRAHTRSPTALLPPHRRLRSPSLFPSAPPAPLSPPPPLPPPPLSLPLPSL